METDTDIWQREDKCDLKSGWGPGPDAATSWKGDLRKITFPLRVSVSSTAGLESWPSQGSE